MSYENKNLQFGGWAIDKEEWNELSRILNEYSVKSVVEFGMGTSSYLFKRCDKYMGYETHGTTIAGHGDVTIIRRDFRNAQNPNDLEKDKKLVGIVTKFDLAFVDGPPGFSPAHLVHGCARLYSTKGAIQLANMIIIHDTKRAGEQNTINSILKNWKKIELKSKRGLTLFIKEVSNAKRKRKHKDFTISY